MARHLLAGERRLLELAAERDRLRAENARLWAVADAAEEYSTLLALDGWAVGALETLRLALLTLPPYEAPP